MEILETQVYRGANYWAPVPVIRFVLDIGDLREWPTHMIPSFCERLAATVPTLGEHRCATGEPGGFFEQAGQSTRLLHVAQHVALELQILAGQKVSYGKAHAVDHEEDTAPLEVSHLIFQYEEAEVGITAGKLAIRMLESLVYAERDPAFDFARQLTKLIQRAK